MNIDNIKVSFGHINNQPDSLAGRFGLLPTHQWEFTAVMRKGDGDPVVIAAEAVTVTPTPLEPYRGRASTGFDVGLILCGSLFQADTTSFVVLAACRTEREREAALFDTRRLFFEIPSEAMQQFASLFRTVGEVGGPHWLLLEINSDTAA